MNKTYDVTATDHELAPEIASLLNTFFDPDFYLRMNTDVAEAGLDPLEHYVTNGYAEGRPPSYAIQKGSFEFFANKSLTWLPSGHNSLAELVDLMRNWPLDDVFGPAPLICPSWLLRQPQCATCESLPDILGTTIPVGDFTLHPALRPYYVSSSRTVLQIIDDIYENDLIQEMSVVDLMDYTENHRDLTDLRDDWTLAFNHLWTYGPLENRLKYLGNRRLRRFSPQENYIAQVKTVFKLQMSRSSLTASRNAKALTPFNLKSFKDAPDIDEGLRFILEEEAEHISTQQAMSNFISLTRIMQDPSTFVLNEVRPADVAVQRVGSRVLTDKDFLTGAYVATTKRVVYAVNIGGYDDLPVPPKLEDCSYYLITDAAEIPADTIWQIVRPTLRENDVKRQCLWYKTHPHWLFPKADFVTWIDSNIQCGTHSETILTSHESMSEIATFNHPDRDCVYKEAAAIADLKLDRADVIERVCSDMREAEFPENAGFYETNVLFSRVQDLGVRSFFDTWWRNIYLGSRRDQMSFTYSAWREGVNISYLDAGFSAKDSRFFSKSDHKSKTGRFV